MLTQKRIYALRMRSANQRDQREQIFARVATNDPSTHARRSSEAPPHKHTNGGGGVGAQT